MGADVDFVVPNRFEFGYGLTPEIVALAAQRDPRLLVTVDNGIASVDGVAAAAARGIDVLITDHHLPGPALPAPAIIVNPNQPGCGFPSKHIAGVGVMFYVLFATRALLRANGAFAARRRAASRQPRSTWSRSAPSPTWCGSTRPTACSSSRACARLRARRAQPGILALFAVAGRDVQRATAFDLGFVAGPRLNAAGRLADMSIGIRCLLADTPEEALGAMRSRARPPQPRAARGRGRQCRRRRSWTCRRQPPSSATIATPSACSGPSGIRAWSGSSRRASRIDFTGRRSSSRARPTASCAVRAARSPGFHLRDALDLVAKRAPGTIAKFGGHAFAAGLTLAEAALPAFREAFEAVAREQLLPPGALARTCESDGALAPGELTLDLAPHAAGAGLGPGLSGARRSTTPSTSNRASASSAASTRSSHSPAAPSAFDAILFGHVDPLPATDPRGLPSRRQRMAGNAEPRSSRSILAGRPELGKLRAAALQKCSMDRRRSAAGT